MLITEARHLLYSVLRTAEEERGGESASGARGEGKRGAETIKSSSPLHLTLYMWKRMRDLSLAGSSATISFSSARTCEGRGVRGEEGGEGAHTKAADQAIQLLV